MNRCRQLMQAALDQPRPTPELVAALHLFEPKPAKTSTVKKSRSEVERRIVPMMVSGGEFCRQKILPNRDWCRRPGAYYGQWMATNRNKHRIFFNRPLCEEHAKEYARFYGLKFKRGNRRGEAVRRALEEQA